MAKATPVDRWTLAQANRHVQLEFRDVMEALTTDGLVNAAFRVIPYLKEYILYFTEYHDRERELFKFYTHMSTIINGDVKRDLMEMVGLMDVVSEAFLYSDLRKKIVEMTNQQMYLDKRRYLILQKECKKFNKEIPRFDCRPEDIYTASMINKFLTPIIRKVMGVKSSRQNYTACQATLLAVISPVTYRSLDALINEHVKVALSALPEGSALNKMPFGDLHDAIFQTFIIGNTLPTLEFRQNVFDMMSMSVIKGFREISSSL